MNSMIASLPNALQWLELEGHSDTNPSNRRQGNMRY